MDSDWVFTQQRVILSTSLGYHFPPWWCLYCSMCLHFLAFPDSGRDGWKHVFEMFSLLKHSNCFLLWGMKYFLNFSCMVSLSSRRQGISFSQECSWEGQEARCGEELFFLHNMFFESNANSYENQDWLTREQPIQWCNTHVNGIP